MDPPLGNGGFKYIDIVPPPGLTGVLIVKVFSESGVGNVYSASLMTHSTYPSACHPPVYRANVGARTMFSTTVGPDVGCDFATLALVKSDFFSGDQPPLSWKVTLLPLRRNNAEGGQDEEEVSSDPNNTGGASGTPFDVAWGAVFDIDGPVSDGALSYRFESVDPGPDGGILMWQLAGLPADNFSMIGRAQFSGYPNEVEYSGGSLSLFEVDANDPSTGLYVSGSFYDITDLILQVSLAQDGTLVLGAARWIDQQDAYDFAQIASTELVPLDQTLRLELQLSSGLAEVRMYDNFSGATIGQAILDTPLLDLSALTIDSSLVSFGSPGGVEVGTYPTYWLDELEASDLGS